MSVKTGIFRIAQVIKWIGLVALIGCVVGGLVSLSDGFSGKAFVGFLMAIFFGGVAYAICRAVAWVLEGFAKD